MSANNFCFVLLLACVVGSVSYTLTRSTLFMGFRRCVTMRYGALAEIGIKCPYCVGHWVSAVAVLAFATKLAPITGVPILDGPFYIFLLAWLQIVAVGLMSAAMKLISTPKEGYVY